MRGLQEQPQVYRIACCTFHKRQSRWGLCKCPRLGCERVLCRTMCDMLTSTLQEEGGADLTDVVGTDDMRRVDTHPVQGKGEGELEN